MPRRLLAYLVAAMLVIWPALVTLSPAFGVEPVFPPGSRIGLEPPGDLKPSTRFPGFEDIDRKAAVTILELPANAYAELARAANATEQRGITDVKREDFSFHGGSGLLVTGHVQINDVTLHKWILLATAGANRIHLCSVTSLIWTWPVTSSPLPPWNEKSSRFTSVMPRCSVAFAARASSA